MIDLRIKSQTYSVFALTGHESLFQPFQFDLTLLVNADVAGSSKDWLLQQAILQLPARAIVGIVVCQHINITQQNGLLRLQVRLVPRFALLLQQHSATVCTQQSVTGFLQQQLSQLGYRATQLKAHYQACYAPVPLLLQPPTENDAAFLQRLCAQVGLFFWFGANTNNAQADEIVYSADNHALFEKTTASADITQVHVHYQSVPDHFIVRDYNDQMPSQKIMANAGNGHSCIEQQFFGLGCQDDPSAETLAQYFHQAWQIQMGKISAKSADSALAPGRQLLWNNEPYLIIHSMHSASQPSGTQGEGNSIDYQQHCDAVPSRLPFRWLPRPAPPLPSIITAQVDGEMASAHLDEQGRYHITSLPPLRRINPYSSVPGVDGDNGMHLPLLDQTEVLLSFLYGDPHRPLIMGSMHNAERTSPVNASNSTQHILQSQAGNIICMDDTKGQTGIVLQNPNAINMVRFTTDQDNHTQTQLSSQGDIHLLANANLDHTSGYDTTEKIGQDFTQTIYADFNSTTQRADMVCRANTQQLTAAQGAFLSAGQTAVLQSGQGLLLNAQKNIQCVVKQQPLFLQSANGNIVLRAGQALHIIGNGKRNLQFTHGNAAIEITSDGVVNFNGQKITLVGQPIFSTKPS